LVTDADTVGVDRFAQVRHVMSTELHTVPAEADPRTGFDRLSQGRRRLAPVVDVEGRLVGVLTRKGALRATLYRPALDGKGRLRVAAAIGINGDVAGKGGGADRGRCGHPRRGHRARPPGANDRCARYGRSTRRYRSPPAMWSPPRAYGTWSRRARTSSRWASAPG
jgi:CBS domain-containing protein